MYTRKQQWRHTKTRNIGKWSQEKAEADLAAEEGRMPRALTWNQAYALGMQFRGKRIATSPKCAPNGNGVHKFPGKKTAITAAMATGHQVGGMSGEPVNFPRSISDSNLSTRRTIFPRNSSKHEFGPAPSRPRETVRRPNQKSVSFNTQVKMVLVAKREELSDEDKARVWWGKDDYARFRRVLIEWKLANMHRVSQSNNILSLRFGGVDDEDTKDHHEPVAAADATTAAAAAQAAAAATAAEVARAQEEDRAAREKALASEKRTEERAGVEGLTKPKANRRHLSRASFSLGENGITLGSSNGGGIKGVEAYFANNDTGARTTLPFRRINTFVTDPPPTLESPLRAVALSDLQATAQSLREWQKTFNAQGKGRAAPKLAGPVGPEVEQDSSDSEDMSSGEEEETETEGLSDQSVSPSNAARATGANPVLIAFERQQREAAALRAELEEDERARAAAMVKAAKAEAAKAEAAKETKAEATKETKAEAAKETKAEVVKETKAATSGGEEMAGAEHGGGGEPVVQLGLNDAPGSAAAAAAVGVHVATDGVSNLALRSRDSIENLQALDKESCSPEPLSSST